MNPVNIFPSQNILGEGPLWSVEEQAIYWLDIDGKKIQRLYPETKKHESFDVPIKVCLMAFRKKGGMICGTEDGFYFWDPETQKMDYITHPEKGKKEERLTWSEFIPEKLSAKVMRLPTRADVTVPVTEQLIVDFYSKQED